jgi:hypothetical protein
MLGSESSAVMHHLRVGLRQRLDDPAVTAPDVQHIGVRPERAAEPNHRS